MDRRLALPVVSYFDCHQGFQGRICHRSDLKSSLSYENLCARGGCCLVQQEDPDGSLRSSSIWSYICLETVLFLSLSFLLYQNQQGRRAHPARLTEAPPGGSAGNREARAAQALQPSRPQSSPAPLEADSAATPTQTLFFLTANIAELVFGSEQEQKSLEFFIRDLLSFVFAKPQPWVSVVHYLYFSFVTDELFSKSTCPCSRETPASHAVLKPAFSGSHGGERKLRSRWLREPLWRGGNRGRAAWGGVEPS